MLLTLFFEITYSEFMAIWLKTLFFVFVLSVSVFSGMPFGSGDMNMKSNVCPMKCCKELAKSNTPQKTDAKYLCSVMVCSQSMPTNTSSSVQVNFAPVIVASERESLFDILFAATGKERAFPLAIKPPGNKRTYQAKYIQHQRILI